ncbi:hypothetical protein [Bacillus alkalicellulosilyticus]|uniref:hypothetical protein n=1 Tax=Alkalihalobacterium alkalicellulosilyticum TaxID=1912214 RepID=UPI0009977E90|nr:hypothetical protein [Bacillus alkalicellulosilyticus]
MEYIIIGLFLVSLILFILSFFQKDRTKDLENQVENFSITLMQEIYQLKKKIKIVEEELLIGSDSYYSNSPTKRSVDNMIQEVVQYYEAGYSIDNIAEVLSITEQDVQRLLATYLRKD